MFVSEEYIRLVEVIELAEIVLSRWCKVIYTFSDAPKKFITFDEVVAQRRAEARRSLVVQVNSDSSFNELYGYCSRYASITGIHHYKNNGGEVRRHLSLQNRDSVVTKLELIL